MPCGNPNSYNRGKKNGRFFFFFFFTCSSQLSLRPETEPHSGDKIPTNFCWIKKKLNLVEIELNSLKKFRLTLDQISLWLYIDVVGFGLKSKIEFMSIRINSDNIQISGGKNTRSDRIRTGPCQSGPGKAWPAYIQKMGPSIFFFKYLDISKHRSRHGTQNLKLGLCQFLINNIYI